MSQARRINDYGGEPHSSDMAMKSKNKLKHYNSADGAGKLGQYEQTSEDIEGVQHAGDGKAKGHPMKPGYRN